MHVRIDYGMPVTGTHIYIYINTCAYTHTYIYIHIDIRVYIYICTLTYINHQKIICNKTMQTTRPVVLAHVFSLLSLCWHRRVFFIFSSSAPSSSPDHPIDLQGWNAISKLAGIFRAATASLYDRICTACSTELAVKKYLSMGLLHLVHLLTRSLSSTVCLQLWCIRDYSGK